MQLSAKAKALDKPAVVAGMLGILRIAADPVHICPILCDL